ncbi:MAG: Rpn family recombination-promoting nuclease/putative transposase, partial [Bacteroidales bacterium]|nr:Rpn family recombination-promoting nuclease/putative transposase [Bacteroidales bacterium]
NFVDRSIYYSAFPIQEQGVRGYLSKIDKKYINWDYSLKKVYVVGILSFILDENPNHNEIITHARLRYDEYSNEVYSDKLEFINIELPKFNKQVEDLDDDNMLDKWLFAIKNLYHLMDRPQALREAIFTRLFNLAEISKYNKAERLAYQESLKDYRDYYNTIASAEERGREEGEIIGIEKGRAEGRAEEKLEMARKMKADGMSYEIITKYSGLSIDEIEKL